MAQEGAASLTFAVDIVAPARLFEAAVSALFDTADRAVAGMVTCVCGDEIIRVGPPQPHPWFETGRAAPVVAGVLADEKRRVDEDRVHWVASAGDVVAVWLGNDTLQWTHLAQPDRPVRCCIADTMVDGLDVAGSFVCWRANMAVGFFDVSRDEDRWRWILDHHPRRAFLSAHGVVVSASDDVVLLLDSRTGRPIHERSLGCRAPDAVRDGRMVLADTDSELGVYEVATLERVGGAAVALSSIASSALSAEGRWAVAADVYGRVARLETTSGAVRLTEAPRRVGRVSLSDDGRLTTLSSRDYLCVHDADTDEWIELRGGPDGHGLEPNNNEVIAVSDDEVIARDPFRARAWRLDRPNEPIDLVLPDGQRNYGAFRRSDGAVFLLDMAGRLVTVR
ncbi:hypothetical protein SAMN02745121_06543 [Nannocystis exedens]|uniref:PQQ-like domain-containing protein n=2 Tax=Nannocystis exedens TaxID=54 RepID=A0A1I2F8V8_9BACT|nr:hypothetical protein NAEX_06081 [Nannocystis exedens]SFF01782.1 hypothetical protein SAMN02745121_06543 [Nannocystis exedens]